MPNDEFIERAKQALKQQQEASDRAQQEKLHDANVRNTEGPKKWAELSRAIQNLVQQIGEPLEQHSDSVNIRVLNKANKNTVVLTLDRPKAAIEFDGAGGRGGLASVVSGNDLEFRVDGARFPQLANSLGLSLGVAVSMDTLAEKMVGKVIGIR